MQDLGLWANIGSIRNGKTVAFCVLEDFATLCLLGLGLGLGLRGPWVAQAWPKGHPSVAQGRPKRRFGETSLFATKTKKGGVGVGLIRLYKAESTGRGM